MNSRLSQRSGRRGFTLIELLVVILLITILTAVLVPEMRGTFEEALLRSSARQLVGACGVAYGRSVADGQVYRLRFDSTTGKFKVERRAEGMPSAPDRVDVPGGTGTIDPRVVVQLRPGEGEVPSSPAEGEGVSFFPDGTAEGAEFILRDRAGFRLSIRINPVTARPKIQELASQ